MRTSYRPRTLVRELVMIAVAVMFLFPVYALVTLAFKDPGQIANKPLSLPNPPSVGSFGEAWQSASLGSALLNSTLITVSSVVILIVLGSLAAYFLARTASRLSYSLYILFLVGIILPFQLGMIPLYQLVDDMGLLGTYQGMILFYTGIQLPFTVFLYTGFIRSLPADYTNAALIDGASHLQAFGHVIFPLLRPITGTVLILNAVHHLERLLHPAALPRRLRAGDRTGGFRLRRRIHLGLRPRLRRAGARRAADPAGLPAPAALRDQGFSGGLKG